MPTGKNAKESKMKKIMSIAITLSMLIGAAQVCAGEVMVKIISTLPTTTSTRSHSLDTQAIFLQIEDSKNGVVCYGIASSSDADRTPAGGYPGTAISCVQVKK